MLHKKNSHLTVRKPLPNRLGSHPTSCGPLSIFSFATQGELQYLKLGEHVSIFYWTILGEKKSHTDIVNTALAKNLIHKPCSSSIIHFAIRW